MARGPRPRPQRRRPGRRPCRAGPGILVPGRPMNDRPDASEARLTTGAGTGPDADAAGTALDTGSGRARIAPPTGTGPAGPRWDTSHGPPAIGWADSADPAGTATGPGTEAVATTRARVMATRLAGGWPLRRTFLVGFVIVTVF